MNSEFSLQIYARIARPKSGICVIRKIFSSLADFSTNNLRRLQKGSCLPSPHFYLQSSSCMSAVVFKKFLLFSGLFSLAIIACQKSGRAPSAQMAKEATMTMSTPAPTAPAGESAAMVSRDASQFSTDRRSFK